MAEIIWTEPALNDLDDIANYIAISNVSAAQLLVRNIFNRVDLLESNPQSGKKVPELKSLDYREVIVNPCRIFYKIAADSVYVLHVFRQEQQLKIYALKNQ